MITSFVKTTTIISIIIIITIIRYTKLTAGKTMIQYVLWIAISDTLFAVSTALGYPQPGTTSCYAQGSSSIVVVFYIS